MVSDQKVTSPITWLAMSLAISILVHYGKNQVDTVVVDPTEQVQSLDQHLPLPKKRIVFFHNCMLLGAFTYSFYKIGNGDHIFVVPVAFFNPQTDRTDGPLRFFRHTLGANEEKIPEIRVNPEKRITSFIRETSRIRDTFFQKMEGTVMKHRKTIDYFTAFTNFILPKKDVNPLPLPTPTVIPPKATSVCKEELPIIWIPEKKEVEEESEDEEDCDSENEEAEDCL